MSRKWLAAFAVVVLIAVAIIIGSTFLTSPSTIRYGISPYQDTAMPKVAEGLGLYKQHDIDVELVSVPWEDITTSLASAGESVDIAIGSINTFLPRAENINVKGGGDVVFYFPLYVFKGATMMMQQDSGMKSLSEMLEQYPDDRDRAVRETMEQLRGKTVAVPSGTPYEQMLLAGLKSAEMDPEEDIDIRYVKLADGLLAFFNGDVDVVGAGVTQRTEAMREGAQVFLDAESFGFAEIVGIVTTKSFADEHSEELNTLIRIWFKSVDILMSDVDTHSKHVLDYLDATASTKYTLEEYKAALKFQDFPVSIDESRQMLLEGDGEFYWKRTWDIVNDYLVDTEKIEEPIPYKYFLGDKVISELNE